jgi:hypothetical protein
MMKRGDVIIADDDDDNEVGSSASQNPATATPCTGELFLRTRYIKITREVGGGGGQEIDGKCNTYRSPG